MANPTIAKPTTAVYNSGATLGANLQAMFALTENAGCPIEVVSQTMAQPSMCVNNSIYAQRSGPPPLWISNGFTIGATNYGPSLSFDHATKPFYGGPVGWSTSLSNGGGANARTIACIFKTGNVPYNRTNSGQLPYYGIVNCGSTGPTGLALGTSVVGSVITDKLFLVGTSGNSIISPIIPIEILPNRYYAVAMTISLISGGNTTKTFFVYDLTNQLLHPTSSQTLVNNLNGTLTSTDLWIGSFLNTVTSPSTLGYDFPFVGQIAHVGVWNFAFGASDFNNYVADSCSCARGTYTPSGALTASTQIRQYRKSNTTITCSFGRTTGIGTGGGTGSPTYNVFRAASPTITPGAGGSTQLSSGLINSTNNNTITVTDNTVAPDQEYWYTLQSVDGTQTLNGNAAGMVSASKAPLIIGMIGDSIYQITNTECNIQSIANGDNRELQWVSWNRGGGGLTASNTTLSWQTGCVIPAAQQAFTLAYVNGTPTAGTFELDFPLSSGVVTVTGISFSITATNLQTAINTALGANSVVCTGGPLNSGSITVTTGASGPYNNASLVLPMFNIANSSLTVTPTVTGESVGVAATVSTIFSPGTTANSLWTQALAEFARVGVSAVICQNAANDTPNAGWQTALSAQIAAFQGLGYSVLLLNPITRRSTGSTLPNQSQDQNYFAFTPLITAAAAAAPGTIVGNLRAYGISTQALDPLSMPDAVHPNDTGGFAIAVASTTYSQITKAYDPHTPIIIS